MKKIFKLALFSLVVFLMINVSNATEIKDYFMNATAHDLDFTNLRDTIFTVLRYLGYGIAVCIILFIGVQFLTANSQKRAVLKEKLWLIILGVLVLTLGVPFLKVLTDIIIKLARSLV